MFEPRPEISTPTRRRSAMMGGGPGAARAPGFGPARYGAAARSGLDMPDRKDGFTFFLKSLRDFVHMLGGDNERHADAAVEGARHLLRLDIPLGLEEGHQPGLRPGIGVDPGVEMVRQHAGDILQQSAAGDMGE